MVAGMRPRKLTQSQEDELLVKFTLGKKFSTENLCAEYDIRRCSLYDILERARERRAASNDDSVERSTLERITKEIQEEHCLRLDMKWDERLVPRPFQPRPRPQTAIIAEAAQEKIRMNDQASAMESTKSFNTK